MNTNKTIKTTAVRGPATRKTRIFFILGTSLLITCLLAGFAQAVDNGSVLSTNANPISTIAIGTDKAQEPAATNDGFTCRNHVIRCYDENDCILGYITNAPCYRDYLDGNIFGCENNYDEDFNPCRERYGERAVRMTVLTPCSA